MNPGERFKEWIDSLAEEWKDRLRGWMISWTQQGIIDALEDMEPEQKAAIEAMAQQLIDDPNTPPQVKAFLQQVTTKGNPLVIAAGVILAVFMIIPMVTAISQPLGNILTQKQERLLRTFRLDPMAAINAWRRDPAAYAWVFDDLRDQGWPERSIEALKFFTQVIPNAADIVRFALREVYSPEAVTYGQFQDIPTQAYEDADKAGLPRETFDKFWAAHWNLPSPSDAFEMRHRNIIETDEELKSLLKALDIMPFWRDKMIAMTWNLPTRVDVRRFWDMRTIDEARLREIYTGLGYHGQDLEDYVLWTKIYVDFPDLLARYKNGWITLDTVKAELIAMGMSAARAETLIQEKIKKAAPERVAAEKDLTKADIISGVKKGVISRVQAAELLVDIGYSNDEAVYLLDVNIPTDAETSVKTARELTKGDVLAGLKAGVITEADALSKLVTLRYSAADAAFILKVYKAAVKPPEEAKLKEASKADIVTAVKKGLITQEAGYLMLLDIGFAADAALFILSVAAEESPFSPVTFDEFKDLTQRYRLATGAGGKPMSEEIKKLGAEVVRLSAEVAAIEGSIKTEKGGLLETEGLPATATARLRELQSTLYKAQAELSRVRTDYNAKVAEWRHA